MSMRIDTDNNFDFYPRSPCGERQLIAYQSGLLRDFYPRSPCGERQVLGLPGWLRVLISIHALLAESDAAVCKALSAELYFYPRSPCGERPYMGVTVLGIQHNFYPRSPCGERLADRYEMGIIRQISIHALLAESDASQTNLPGKN